MMRVAHRLVRAALLGGSLLVAACGGSSATRIKPTAGRVAKLDPVDPKAKREFEAGLRAMRLGGPDASETARARLAWLAF